MRMNEHDLRRLVARLQVEVVDLDRVDVTNMRRVRREVYAATKLPAPPLRESSTPE